MFQLLTKEIEGLEERIRMMRFDLEQARSETQRLNLARDLETLEMRLNLLRFKLARLA